MVGSKRRPIPKRVERRLWAESGGICMNPDCTEDLFPFEETVTFIGEIAHIYPYSDRGPRHDEIADAPDERNSLENLILLCRNCHSKIDQEDKRFRAGLLLEWRSAYRKKLTSGYVKSLEQIQSVSNLHPATEKLPTILYSQKPLLDPLLMRHSLFGGRDAELERLNQFLSQRVGGYLFITGESGFGKTALLANWVKALQKDDQPLAYHFISPYDGTADERSTLLNLCEQLASYHEFRGTLQERPDKLRALLRNLLSFPLGKDEKLVVILDGLDEAMGWEQGRGYFHILCLRGFTLSSPLGGSLAVTGWLIWSFRKIKYA
jgi:5-methylcytosine-specific restriction endonuclease McrA